MAKVIKISDIIDNYMLKDYFLFLTVIVLVVQIISISLYYQIIAIYKYEKTN